MLRTVHLALLVTVVAVPRLCLAQDKPDDPVDTTSGPQAAAAPAPPQDKSGVPAFLTDSIRSAIDKLGTTGQTKRGWYLEASNMITGSGWLSLGPGYRKYVFNDKAFADASGALSWHLYKMAQGRFEAPDLTSHHITLGTQAMLQDNTQVHYFGTGPDSLETDESLYRMRSRDFVGYASFRPASSLTLGGEFGWLHTPKFSSPTGTFKPSLPTTEELFPTDPGVTPIDQPSYLHGELSASNDTRDYPGHPTDGGLYRVAMMTYHDQREGTFSFRQYLAEGGQFIPVTGPKWVIALHGAFITSDVSDNHEVPIYLLPGLGASNALRAFPSYRFRDRASLLLNVESRWTIFHRVDAAIFADVGNVSHDAADLNLDKTSIGAGLRVFTHHTTFARMDVAHGSEGWHVTFRTSEPFRFSRVKRHIADLPFVP
jgi:hypothetical protein